MGTLLSRLATLTLTLLPATISCMSSPEPDVIGMEIRYTADDGTECHGYLAYDKNIEGRRPGVLVVHEWWGHNDYVRDRAEQLAALGYTALALDMYGEGKNTGHPQEAGEFMRAVMQQMDVGVQRFEAARSVLEGHPTTDPERTAAIGYCFGGGVVLHMARTGSDLAGVASFHGSLSAQQRTTPDEVVTSVLVCHGAADNFIQPADVEATKKEFGDALEFYEYEGARHGFTNPAADAKAEEFGIGLAYDAEADAQSWASLQDFLARVFS